MGFCVNYRIWIKGFAQVVSSIYHLFEKNICFARGKEQVEAMDLLKLSPTSQPALLSLDYSKNASEITRAVDASLERWGGILMQLVKGKKHPSRYGGGIWSSTEKKYKATKRECQGVIKALTKVRYWLY